MKKTGNGKGDLGDNDSRVWQGNKRGNSREDGGDISCLYDYCTLYTCGKICINAMYLF